MQLTFVEGTTLAFDITYAVDNDARTPIDLTGCAVKFVASPTNSRRRLIDATTETGEITLTPAAGEIRINVPPSATTGAAADWQGARYEIRVTFPSGDVYSLVRGEIVRIEGVIDD